MLFTTDVLKISVQDRPVFGSTPEMRRTKEGWDPPFFLCHERCIAPPVHNDPQLTTLLERCAVDCLGRDKVLPVEQPSLGAEDFAELLRDCLLYTSPSPRDRG